MRRITAQGRSPERRWSKWTKRILITGIGLMAGVQIFHPRRTNPPEQTSDRIEALTHMTPDVARTLDRSCGDCHSNATRWPWYSAVAPISWFVVGHVNEGRRHLNLSEWSRYGPNESTEHLESMCRYVERGFMPLGSYTSIHRDAVLSSDDVRTLCEWTKAESRRLREQRSAAAPRGSGSS